MKYRNSHRYLFLLFFALCALLLSVWSALAQDGEPLPLPGMAPRVFTHAQTLSLPASAGPSHFGNSIARDDQLLVVGAPSYRETGGAAVYFLNQNGVWVPVGALIGDDTKEEDSFGLSVAIHDQTVFVSAPYHDERGAVYVFQPDTSGSWVQQQKIMPTLDEGDEFGVSLHISPAGDQLLITAASRASAFIYAPDASDQWQLQDELRVPDLAAYGWIESGQTFVGSIHETDAGTVHLFKLTAGVWTPSDVLMPRDSYIGDYFGIRIARYNAHLFVTGDLAKDRTGAVYVFQQDKDEWKQIQKIVPAGADKGDQFGSSITMHGTRLAIGSFDTDGEKGAVYFFKWNGTQWVEGEKVQHPTDAIGLDIDLYRDQLLASGPTAFNAVGAVYVYTDPKPLPTDTPTITQLPPPTENVPATATQTPPVNQTPTSTPGSTTQPPVSQLLSDGGFESSAAGWEIKNATGDKVKCNKLEKNKIFAQSGNCAWRFKGGEGEDASIKQTILPILGRSVTTGDTLTLGGYVNASGAVDSKVKVVVKYLDPSVEKSKITVNVNSATGVYVPLSSFQPVLTTSVAAPVGKLKVTVKNSGTSGKVYYDSLSLTAQ